MTSNILTSGNRIHVNESCLLENVRDIFQLLLGFNIVVLSPF